MTPERRNSGARETAVARQRVCKHIHCWVMPHTSHKVATIEEQLKAVFSVRSLQGLHKWIRFSVRSPPQVPTIVGTGNGTPEVPELLSAWGYSWATLSGGYKYGEIECWWGPAANLLYWTEAVRVTKTNDRPDFSSEGAPDIDKTVTVKQ
jgi:hypothetical protein